jgi:MHS family alpha-ketoglutarate permease-like MFS transporter
MTKLELDGTRVSPMTRARAILGGSAGNLIEWYDWFAYASFSLYFAKDFFPGGDQTARLLQTAAVFAVGFFARPVGAWAFGLYADRRGRKAALTTSVAMMCFGSLMVAVVPGYGTIGSAAPIILTLARLLQGFSIGGEYGASATYLSEMAGRDRRGFWSSFQFLTLIGGQLTALGVLIVLQHTLTVAQLGAWGWRIPFVIGAALAIVVYFIQTRLSETSSFEATKSEVDASSIRRLLGEHPAEVGIIFMLSGAGALGFYCFTTYMQKFLTNTGHFSKGEASTISAASLIAYLLMMPLFGWLGDRFGRRNLLIFAFGAGALVVWPILVGISHTTNPWIALGLICAFLVTLSGYSAVNAVVKAELFPAKIRGLGVSLPYAVANAIFGGTAEYVALFLKKAGHEAVFYIYVAVVLAAGAAVALRMRDTQALSLIDSD